MSFQRTIGKSSRRTNTWQPTTSPERTVHLVATIGGETKVATVQKNKPSQVVFLVPAGLIAGTYNIEVRARVGGGTELRIGRLDPVLTV